MGGIDYNIKKSSIIEWPVRGEFKSADLTLSPRTNLKFNLGQEDKAAPTLPHLPQYRAGIPSNEQSLPQGACLGTNQSI